MARLPSPYDERLPVPRPVTGTVGYRVTPQESLGQIVSETGAAVANTGRQVGAVGAAVAEGAAGKEAAAGKKRRAASEVARAGAGFEEAGGVMRQAAAAERERGSILSEAAGAERRTGAIYDEAGNEIKGRAALYGQAGNEYEQAQGAFGRAGSIYGQAAGIDEATAAAYRSIGAKTRQEGEAFYTELRNQQIRLDKARAEDAFSQLRNQQLDLTDGDAGFKAFRGSAVAKDPDFTKTFMGKFNDAQKALRDGLANDDQKAEFDRRAQISRQQFAEGLLHHLRGQTDEYQKEVYQGTLGTELRNATANWSEPTSVALSLTRIDNAINSQAERLGWAGEYVNALKLQEHSKVHSAVIGQALAEGNYIFAQRWYEANKGDVDKSTAIAVEKAVRDGTQKQIFNGYNSQFIASRNDPKALEAMSKSILENDTLDEDRKNLLLGRIQNRGEVLANRAERARMQWERGIEKNISQITNLTLQGFEPSAEQITPLLNMTKGTQYEGEVRQLIQTANVTSKFRTSTPQQQEAFLTQAEAQVRTDPTKYDVTMLARLRTIHENQQRLLNDDPTSFAVRQGLVDPKTPGAQPLDLTQPAALGDQLKSRLDIARSMSARYGAPMKPLTREEADVLTTYLKAASPTQKSLYFGALSKAAGGDFKGYQAVMAQIAPDDPLSAIAGAYAARANMTSDAGVSPVAGQARMVSDLILAGQAILRPDHKTDGSPSKGALWPMPEETDMEKVFQSVERDAFAGSPTMRRDMYAASKAIYAKLAVDAGDNTGALDTSRWKDAIKLATGGIDKYNGKGVVLPWGYTYGNFKDGLNTRIDALAASGALGEDITPQKLRGLPLENAGDGRYVFRAGDGVLVGKNGRPLVIDFDQSTFIPSGGSRIGPKEREPSQAEVSEAMLPARLTRNR